MVIAASLVAIPVSLAVLSLIIDLYVNENINMFSVESSIFTLSFVGCPEHAKGHQLCAECYAGGF